MTQMVQEGANHDAIRIDRSVKYKVNAGRCDRCGFFKTWGFKVLNPKTGKMMPGHVTEEGFKINDGDCPYWSSFKRKNHEKGNENGNRSQDRVTTNQVANIKSEREVFFGKPRNAPDSHAISILSMGMDTLSLTVDGVQVNLTREEALVLARRILVELTS